MTDDKAQPQSLAQPQQSAQPLALHNVDNPGLAETFADSIGNFIFDGHTARLELTVTRFDQPKPQSPLTGRRVPACRDHPGLAGRRQDGSYRR